MSERREHTTRLLINAAEELIADRGVNAATIVQICERAGFTRGAFYSNFTSKNELCLAVLNRQMERYLASLIRASQGLEAKNEATSPGHHDPISEALNVFLGDTTNDITGLLVRMEMRLHALRTPDFRRPLLSLQGKLVRQVATILTAAVTRLHLELRLPARKIVTQLYAEYETQASAAILLGRPLTSPETIRKLRSVLAKHVHPTTPAGCA